jgi:hypothetical protein
MMTFRTSYVTGFDVWQACEDALIFAAAAQQAKQDQAKAGDSKEGGLGYGVRRLVIRCKSSGREGQPEQTEHRCPRKFSHG